MFCQCGGIAQYDQFHSGTGDGNIHAAQVVQETYISLVIGSYQADHDHIALLALETVYGMNGNQFAEGFEKEFRLIKPRIYCTCDL